MMEQHGENAIFKFKDKEWAKSVDDEFKNYDYLMGGNLDFSNQEVIAECKRWGLWYERLTKVDGFRLDALKHIESSFYKEWLEYIRKESKKELFSVGEYWTYKVDKLHKYLEDVDYSMSLFDVPLHDNLYRASTDFNFDMSRLLDGTLVKENPEKAVTFVDNHDTQPEQGIESFIERWMKQIAYSVILLREDGYPCVFYGDLFGIEHSKVKPVDRIKTLMTLRKLRAYGKQHDYFDDRHIIGWTREGDEKHISSGLAVVASNSCDGEKWMYIGKKFAGEKFIDCLDNCFDVITIGEDGYRSF